MSNENQTDFGTRLTPDSEENTESDFGFRLSTSTKSSSTDSGTRSTNFERNIFENSTISESTNTKKK